MSGCVAGGISALGARILTSSTHAILRRRAVNRPSSASSSRGREAPAFCVADRCGQHIACLGLRSSAGCRCLIFGGLWKLEADGYARFIPFPNPRITGNGVDCLRWEHQPGALSQRSSFPRRTLSRRRSAAREQCPGEEIRRHTLAFRGLLHLGHTEVWTRTCLLWREASQRRPGLRSVPPAPERSASGQASCAVQPSSSHAYRHATLCPR